MEELGDTLNFIGICFKLFEENYDARCVDYSTAMKEMFKEMPLTMIRALTPKKSPENYDINWWWIVYGKSTKGLTPLSKSTLSKKSQD